MTETTPAVDDASLAAAEGTRTTARWIASALGAIPSLAVLASIVRAPGEAGFDPTLLALGVGLAAVGALVGLLAFARVLAPLALEEKHVVNVDLNRIPGQPYTSWEQLKTDLSRVRDSVVETEHTATQAEAESKSAQTEANRLDDVATKAEEAASAASGNLELADKAKRAREDAVVGQIAATSVAERAASLTATLALWTAQLTRREAIVRDLYRLKAADEVGRR
jgi:hypothetical protein